MRRVLAVMVVMLGLVAAAPAADAAETGLFVGASVGTAFLDTTVTPTLELDENDFAWKIMVGYRFMKYLAVEGSYRDLGKIQGQTGTGMLPSPASFNSCKMTGTGFFVRNSNQLISTAVQPFRWICG